MIIKLIKLDLTCLEKAPVVIAFQMAIAKFLMLVLAAGCVVSQTQSTTQSTTTVTTPEPADYDDGSQQGVLLDLRFPKLEQQNQQLAAVLTGVAAKLNALETMIAKRLGTLTYVGCLSIITV